MDSELELVLWVKPDCQACQTARELMASLSAAMRFEWSERDASEAPDMIYADIVPVVTTETGEVLAHAPLIARDLVDAILAQASRSDGFDLH